MPRVSSAHLDYAQRDQAHNLAAIKVGIALRNSQREDADRAERIAARRAAQAIEADRAVTSAQLEHAHALLDASRRAPDNRELALRASAAATAVGITERQRCAGCDDPDADPFWRPGVDPVAFYFMCGHCAANKYVTTDGRAIQRREERAPGRPRRSSESACASSSGGPVRTNGVLRDDYQARRHAERDALRMVRGGVRAGNVATQATWPGRGSSTGDRRRARHPLRVVRG